MRFGGKELYRDIFLKASCYFESLARNHPFIDGNKRTAVLATARFLFLNGYELTASNKALENFTLRVVVKKIELPKIAVWLKEHSRRIKKVKQ